MNWRESLDVDQLKQVTFALLYDTPEFQHRVAGAGDLRMIAALARELDRLQSNNDVMEAALIRIKNREYQTHPAVHIAAAQALAYLKAAIKWEHEAGDMVATVNDCTLLVSREIGGGDWYWLIRRNNQVIAQQRSIKSADRAVSLCVDHYRTKIEVLE